MTINTDLAGFVETCGLVMEGMGLPRMGGRVLGWLLVCEPAHQSAAQLAAALSASTGSISGTTGLLLRYGLIDRVAFPGDRRQYFLLRPGLWWQMMQQRLLGVHAFRELAEQGAKVVDTPSALSRLHEVSEFYHYLEEALAHGMARWQAAQTASSP